MSYTQTLSPCGSGDRAEQSHTWHHLLVVMEGCPQLPAARTAAHVSDWVGLGGTSVHPGAATVLVPSVKPLPPALGLSVSCCTAGLATAAGIGVVAALEAGMFPRVS